MKEKRAAGERTTILVTGAAGIIGPELVLDLRERYGDERVIAGYRSSPLPREVSSGGPSVQVDVSDFGALEQVVTHHDVGAIYHLAAVLSSAAERDVQLGWQANVEGLYNVLESARRLSVPKIFLASSIAVFGETTPKHPTPQDTILHPTSFYGVSKRFGELLGAYYAARFGVDVRGLRYPGIISPRSVQGERTISRTIETESGTRVVTGSTDFVTSMIQAAIRGEAYECCFHPETVLPLMYIDDCVKATVDLMHAGSLPLHHRCEYNLRGIEFTAAELAQEIERQTPGFRCEFRPDERQLLADATARAIDDSAAREEWGWSPEFDLPRMTQALLRAHQDRLHPQDP